MTWFGWLIVGALIGVALAAALVACVGRERSGRGGTLTFDSPDARAVFKHRREAAVFDDLDADYDARRDEHDPPPTSRFDSDWIGKAP